MHVNKQQLSAFILIALLTFSVLVVPSSAVHAQQAQSGQALEISPPSLPLNVDPGERREFTLLIRNVSSSDLIATGEVNDFVASGEGGIPRILLDEDESQDNPYSFKDWIEPLPETLLAPGELKSIPIVINVPENATPGGHYGVIRYSGSAPELDQTGVSLAASLGTLVFLDVSGDTTLQLEIEEFSINKDGVTGTIFQSTPLTLVERLRNVGNTHVQPRGTVALTNMFGRNVASANVNLADRYVLPGPDDNNTRRFEQQIDEALIGDRWLFGRYTADLELTYGDNQTVSDQLNFWVIPYRLVAAVVVGLVALFFISRTLLRRYNERVISKARRR
jgi:hypothetical protein